MTNKEQHDKFMAAYRQFIAGMDAHIQGLRAKGLAEVWKDNHEVSAEDCAFLWDAGIRVDEDLYRPLGSWSDGGDCDN